MGKRGNIVTDDKAKDNEIILKVADLIEQGSKDMVQIAGHYFYVPIDEKDQPGCCAMGAMYRALGVEEKLSDPHFSGFEELGIVTWPLITYPDIKSDSTNPPPFAARANIAAIPDVVIYLNDRLKWDFNRIVSYLRGIATPHKLLTRARSARTPKTAS